ncbi:MAG: hypothetical protein KDB03_03160 [Planctomycetales bacterium]|nr:hypothetical protein [Planctomycetales bacterium]
MGNGGNDRLYGQTGRDELFGGSVMDSLFGGLDDIADVLDPGGDS